MFLHRDSPFGSLVAGGYLFARFIDIENSTGYIFGSLYRELLIIAVFHLGVRLTESLVGALEKRRVRSGKALPKFWRKDREKDGDYVSRSGRAAIESGGKGA